MHESRAEMLPQRFGQLWPNLAPTARRSTAQLCHQLLWQLFADSPDRRRDFLFQVERTRPLTVILRSARPPQDALGLWSIQTRAFAPVLQPGQVLRFRMEAVATRSAMPRPDGKRGQRQDVAMAAFMALSPGDREGSSPQAMAEGAGLAWLDRQGAAHGFRRRDAQVLDYRRHRVPTRKGEPLVFGSLLFGGTLEVGSPDDFVRALGEGFGSARAFGFGLMQVAPALPDP